MLLNNNYIPLLKIIHINNEELTPVVEEMNFKKEHRLLREKLVKTALIYVENHECIKEGKRKQRVQGG